MEGVMKVQTLIKQLIAGLLAGGEAEVDFKGLKVVIRIGKLKKEKK